MVEMELRKLFFVVKDFTIINVNSVMPSHKVSMRIKLVTELPHFGSMAELRHKIWVCH